MTRPVVQERRFDPLPKQREFLEATEPELLYSGAWGAGKSRVGCEKGHFLSVHYPGNRGLIVRKVYKDLPSSTLISLFEDVLAPSDILDHHKTLHRILVRSNDPQRPSEIWYGGLDRASAFGSTEFGWIFVDEAVELEENDWLWLDGRLRFQRVPFRQMFTATNPGAPSHWLHKRFYRERPVDAQGRPVRRVIESNSLENPHLPADYLARLGRLTGVHRDRYVLGKWVGYEGLVYPAYNPLVHEVDAFPVPRHWAKYRSVDFGTANPFVCQWWAVDPADGAAYRYREVYMTGRRATEHGKQIVDLTSEEEAEGIVWTVADHDAGDRLDLQAAGVLTVPARKEIDEGIQAVANRLAEHPVTKRPRLFFMRGVRVEEDPRLVQEGLPTCTEEEFGRYKWARGAHETTKDVPLDKDNHGMDATRYFVMMLDRGGTTPVVVRSGDASLRAPRGVRPGELYGVKKGW